MAGLFKFGLRIPPDKCGIIPLRLAEDPAGLPYNWWLQLVVEEQGCRIFRQLILQTVYLIDSGTKRRIRRGSGVDFQWIGRHATGGRPDRASASKYINSGINPGTVW
jgi:hypothetical protein